MAGEQQLTLAAEHSLLLRQVTARSEDVLTAAAAGRWPGPELAALAEYAQAEVLRQVSDEEALLFRSAPAQQVTALARDHVRLRSAAEINGLSPGGYGFVSLADGPNQWRMQITRRHATG